MNKIFIFREVGAASLAFTDPRKAVKHFHERIRLNMQNWSEERQKAMRSLMGYWLESDMTCILTPFESFNHVSAWISITPIKLID